MAWNSPPSQYHLHNKCWGQSTHILQQKAGLAEAGGSEAEVVRKQKYTLFIVLQNAPTEKVGLAEAFGSSRKLKWKQHFNVYLFGYRVFETAHIYIYIYIIYIPPHQGSGAGIAIKGDAWVSGWYPAATELNILKKACSSQKQLVSFYVFLRFLRRQDAFPSSRALIFFM